MSRRSVAPLQQRKTISEKKALIEKWNTSKSTMKEICGTHGISISAIKYWCRQFKAEPKRKRKRKGFVPVAVCDSKREISFVPADIFAEIILQNGHRILFHQPVEVNILKAIVG